MSTSVCYKGHVVELKWDTERLISDTDLYIGFFLEDVITGETLAIALEDLKRSYHSYYGDE